MTPPRPPRHLFAILVAVTFISPLANHMFIPAMPAVKADFGIGDELAFAALSVTMMTMAVTTIVYGGFSDQWGRKRVPQPAPAPCRTRPASIARMSGASQHSAAPAV